MNDEHEVEVVKRNALAVRRTIAALRALGCCEGVDEGVLALVRSTADSLDRAVPGTAAAASCARVHLLALDRLRGLTTHDANDGLDLLLGTLGDTAQP